jgi:PKD repeat protein
MMKHFLFFLLFFTTRAIAQDSVSVLFIGNSYTYVNDLPGMLSQFAASQGDVVTQDSKTNGGYTFQNHLNDPLTHAKIQNRPWDFVVLQGQSQEPSFPYSQVTSATYPPAKSLTDSVFSANFCSQVLYFMTWGRKNGDPQWDSINTFDKMNTRLEQAYLSMMNQAQSSVAPIAIAWKRVVDEHPTIELYSSDGSHPSLAGTYLATCVFYASLFRKSPLNTTYYAGLDPATALILQEISDEVVLGQLSSWKLRPKSNIAIADFSFTQNDATFVCVNSSWRSTSFLWNFGDLTTSTLSDPEHTYLSDGSYELTLISSNVCGADTLTEMVELNFANAHELETSTVYSVRNEDGTYSFMLPNTTDFQLSAIFSQTGQLVPIEDVVKEVSSTNQTLDFSKFPKGVYYILISYQGVQTVYKLLHE